ncbi:cyclin-Q [Ischnura elegans]|uniref:cyclin-Q n=1 Tax=Ischnura elegans TaxID=197161 RepID=UPI001ED88485|nr:cyclin-Q [Ischnura elegans]
MKDVIDVMQLQREKSRVRVPPIDYRESQSPYAASRYIFECGIKLDAQPLTIATATILFHRFFKETDRNSYDPFLIAATTLYLAGKVEDDQIKIRDVINVTHNSLHRGSAPLELGEEYWNMRDAIVQAELLLMRMLRFEVTCVHPHKYMFHYLKTLEGWFEPAEWRKYPIVRSSSSFLQDFHHDPSILEYKPQHTAIACINMALQVYGVKMPVVDDLEGMDWFSVFSEDATCEKIWEIMEKIMDAYSNEPEED